MLPRTSPDFRPGSGPAPVRPPSRRAAGCLCLLLALFPSLPAAAAAPARPGAGPALSAFVSILPQVYFVQRVGGSRVRVEALVRPGDNPATYEPSPRQIARLVKARVYFRVGVPFENALLPRLEQLAPKVLVVDTRRGIPLQPMVGDFHREHPIAAGPDLAANLDPHIWLDPSLVKTQAKTILETLCRLDPAGSTAYRENYRLFIQELSGLDRRIRKILAPARGRPMLVFHPSFGYFARAYGLQQMAVEMEGKEPQGRDLAALVKRAKSAGVRALFVQPEFPAQAAQTVAEALRGTVVYLDPLAEDYPRNLEKMAVNIAAALSVENSRGGR